MLLASCWQPLDKELPGFETQIVVQSTISPDSIFTVSLSQTQSVLNLAEPNPIVDADVKIFQGDELVAQLVIPAAGEEGSDIPIFRTTSVKPERAIPYNLKVEVEGFEAMEATTNIPEEVRVSDVNIVDLKLEDNFQDRNLKNANISGNFLIDNTNDGDHFYHLAWAELIFDWYTIANGDTTFQENKDSILIPIENITPGNENFTSLLQEPGFLIMDEGGSGNYLNIPFKVSTQINPSNQVLSHLNIYVRHTTRDYFKFHETVTKQTLSNSINSEPVPIHSNVDNGQGHFSGFSTTKAVYRFR